MNCYLKMGMLRFNQVIEHFHLQLVEIVFFSTYFVQLFNIIMYLCGQILINPKTGILK